MKKVGKIDWSEGATAVLLLSRLVVLRTRLSDSLECKFGELRVVLSDVAERNDPN